MPHPSISRCSCTWVTPRVLGSMGPRIVTTTGAVSAAVMMAPSRSTTNDDLHGPVRHGGLHGLVGLLQWETMGHNLVQRQVAPRLGQHLHGRLVGPHVLTPNA